MVDLLGLQYKERLNQKLDNRFPLDLESQYTLQNISQNPSLYFDNDTNIMNEETVRDKLVDLLEYCSFLLILGEPGAGKTSQLLELGISLLEKCRENNESPIPIILNLITFTDKYENFEVWIQSSLKRMYNSSPVVAADIVKKIKLFFCSMVLMRLEII